MTSGNLASRLQHKVTMTHDDEPGIPVRLLRPDDQNIIQAILADRLTIARARKILADRRQGDPS
jgi:hypothetical protein